MMTQLRQRMLEELQRRNYYSPGTSSFVPPAQWPHLPNIFIAHPIS